jgi:Kdo2-lipid IVA lauroyltransferase/acyltransferase
MYQIAFGLLYLISLLPFRVLFLVSDFCSWLLSEVIGYRRKVVHSNLERAFPDKSAKERKRIARRFYRNFCDNWVEALKLLSISEKTLAKRVSSDFEVFDRLYASGRCCHMLLGHQFNWEWGNGTVPVRTPYKVLVAYSPITNKVFDRLFLHIRARFGCVLLPFNDMRRAMLPHRHSRYILALVADQNPPNPLKSYWLEFLHTPTAFVQGPEKGARLGNIPAVFLAFSKPRRGYYHLEAKLLHDQPGQTAEGELTRLYVEELERNIRRSPELYLWSHKRFKHAWQPAYGKLWVGSTPPPQGGTGLS